MMEIAPEWDNVTWKNNLNTTVAIGQSLVHNLQTAIRFHAFASNDYGCPLKEEFDLNISKPDLKVDGTHYQIVKGNSVSFSASGGDFYLWAPGASLDNNQIANPIATPEETTEYQVTAFDSLGCEAKATVLVEVFEEAFIPTLFTPNGDGRNDNLKIYGLTQANDFRFVIFNREGNKLFDTSSVDEATQSGWSGAVNGHLQPPGTYYWKVEGSMPKGDLLLSGKKSGVFLLVR
jgi:gliding motility-associated-like protein